jgi:hypothetical protein
MQTAAFWFLGRGNVASTNPDNAQYPKAKVPEPKVTTSSIVQNPVPKAPEVKLAIITTSPNLMFLADNVTLEQLPTSRLSFDKEGNVSHETLD